MLDKSKIGHEFPPFKVKLDKGVMRLFAKAIGESDPIYTDEKAARAAGYSSLPMPLTYPFQLGKDIPNPSDTLHLLDLDFSDIVHGAQEFTYHKVVCAGDVITGQKRIVDIYDKKHGTLEFVVVETDFKDMDDKLVCESNQTIIVIRNRKGSL